jgi:hypothetical protein
MRESYDLHSATEKFSVMQSFVKIIDKLPIIVYINSIHRHNSPIAWIFYLCILIAFSAISCGTFYGQFYYISNGLGCQ